MKRDYIVYKVTIKDRSNWYVLMPNDYIITGSLMHDEIKCSIIKENLTKKESFNFCKIMNKLK